MSTRNTPKTPYEIRLDLLQLAFEVLTAKHYATACSKVTATNGTLLVTSSPSVEEIVAEAEKMNAFISKANQSH